MALDTVNDYVDAARVLLQDTREPYRHSTAELVAALNIGILETRRLRPDILRSYLRTSAPSYSAAALSTEVDYAEAFRPALVYHIAGYASLRDDENHQDARATVLMNKFVGSLLTMKM
jgi:hypothetical protein